MKPSRIEFDLGLNRHNQPLRFVRTFTNGAFEWSLYRDAENQRDDATSIGGLNAEHIRLMLAAVEAAK